MPSRTSLIFWFPLLLCAVSFDVCAYAGKTSKQALPLEQERHFVRGLLVVHPDIHKSYRIDLKPGETISPHVHHNNFLLIPLTDLYLRFVEHGAKTSTRRMTVGQVAWGWAGTEHSVKNIGNRQAAFLLVELLFDVREKSKPRYLLATKSPDGAFELLYRESGAAVWRTTLKSGQSMHWVPGGYTGIGIYVEDADIFVASDRSGSSERRMPAGSVVPFPPSFGAFTLTNRSDAVKHVIWVEKE